MSTPEKLLPQRMVRPLLRRVAAGIGAVIVFVALVAVLPAVRLWAASVTGETSFVQGIKGLGSLAVLEFTGPRPELAPLATSAHLDVNPYGVNVFLQLEADAANVRRTFELLARSGIGWARQEFPWEDIEIHARGDFTDRRHEPERSAWLKYDTIVDLAADHGVNLLVRLSNPPDWAFADPDAAGEKGPPDDLADLNRFVGSVVERYCGRVGHYQIWNEPNIYPEWGERDVDPVAFAALASGAAAAARAACPGVVIVSAALAPTTEPGGRNMDDLAFLEALYEAGWADDFDVLAAQGFGLWTGPMDRRTSRDRTNFSRVTLVRDVMVRHGDAAKPVWVTEMGWNSPPEGIDAPNALAYGQTTEDVRARYTVQAYQRMQAEWPWAGVGFVWMLRRPDWEWHNRGEGYFRLLEPDWQETASFRALAELATRPLQLHRGRHLPSHPALVYSGPWRHADGARVGAPGAEMAFPFDGSSYRIVTGASSEGFEAFVVVDGVTGTVRAAPGAEEAAFTVEGAAGLRAVGLQHGSHTGIVRVDAGSLPVHLIEVGAPDPPGIWAPAIVPALIVLLAVLAAAGLWVVLARL